MSCALDFLVFSRKGLQVLKCHAALDWGRNSGTKADVYAMKHRRGVLQALCSFPPGQVRLQRANAMAPTGTSIVVYFPACVPGWCLVPGIQKFRFTSLKLKLRSTHPQDQPARP